MTEREKEKPAGIDLWKAIAADKENSESDAGLETTVVFVGPKQCGKTTLISRFLNPDKEQTPKPTVGMEYTFGRRVVNLQRDVAHLWEIGGGQMLSGLMDIPLNAETLEHSMVVIVCDLSKPDECLSSVNYWMDRVHTRVEALTKQMRVAGSPVPDRLKERQKNSFGSAHPDVEKNRIWLGIPILIVANKLDEFSHLETELRKTMARTLRFVAHINGASLVYTHQKDKALLTHFRTAINHFVFKGPPIKAASLDHLKAIIVPAGQDTIQQIGMPDVVDPARATTQMEMWELSFTTRFPVVQRRQSTVDVAELDEMGQFKEQAIDQARAQKEEELERYKKEQSNAEAQQTKTKTRVPKA